MNFLKLSLLLIVFPLLLAAGGAWELQRADSSAAEFNQLQVDITAAKPTLLKLARQHRKQVVTVDGQKIAVIDAISKLEKAEGEMQAAHTVTHVLQVLARLVIGLGLLAALVGLAALAATKWAGDRALQSREKLLQVFSFGSRLLPYVLVSQVVAMAAAVALILLYEGLGMWHLGRMSGGEFKLMGVAGIVAAACLYSIWQVLKQLRSMLAMFEPTPLPMLGSVVSAAQAQGLWKQVSELATRLGALPPDHIVVSMAEGFYVTSSDAEVHPAIAVLSGRTLHVPLLYLGLLDHQETAAVIGHELAHFVGEDTEYSMHFLPIYDGVTRSLSALANTMLGGDAMQVRIMQPAFMLGVFFMESFDHAVNHWSRERELLADATGARLVGSTAIASALVRISAIDPQLDLLLMAHLDLALSPEANKHLLEDLPGTMIGELQRTELKLPPEELEAQLPHPTDSHPSNGDRMAALQVNPEDAVRVGTRAVDAPAACAALDAYFTEPLALRRQLSGDLISQVARQDATYAAPLKTQVDAVKGEQILHEGSHWRGVTGMVFSACLLVLSGFVLYQPLLKPAKAGNTLSLQVTSALIVGGIALVLLVFAVRLIKRAHKTALRLTPDHFVFANLVDPLPIKHIANVSLTIGQGTRLTLLLEPDAPLPQVAKSAFGVPGVRLNKKQRVLQLQVVQMCIDDKALKSQALLDLISAYVNAAHARGILHERQV